MPEAITRASRWGGAFWSDLAERVGSVLVYSLITLVSMDNILERPDWHVLWPIVGLPVVLALLKGLLANFKDYRSGASLLSAPPAGDGPLLTEDGAHRRDDAGRIDVWTVVGVILVVILILVLLSFLPRL